MIIRKAFERGHNSISWLDSYHTFSFAHYRDPKWTHFNKLLVINEDTIAPAMGFGTHPHKDMEIITYVTHGQLRHQDSMGSLGLITPGEIQVMSAGTGITHSEFNNLQDAPTHLLQIWIHPQKKGLEPRYEQKRIYAEDEINFFKVIASPDEMYEDAVKLNADAQIWLGRYDKSTTLHYSPDLFDQYWIQMIKGSIEINNQTYLPGDGIGIENALELNIHVHKDGAEFMILEVGRQQ